MEEVWAAGECRASLEVVFLSRGIMDAQDTCKRVNKAPPHPSTAAMKSGLGAPSTPHMFGRPHQGTGSHMAPPDRRSQVCRLRGTADPKVSRFENKLWLHCTNPTSGSTGKTKLNRQQIKLKLVCMLHNVTYVIILDNDKKDGFWGSSLTFETLWAERHVKKIRR